MAAGAELVTPARPQVAQLAAARGPQGNPSSESTSIPWMGGSNGARCCAIGSARIRASDEWRSAHCAVLKTYRDLLDRNERLHAQDICAAVQGSPSHICRTRPRGPSVCRDALYRLGMRQQDRMSVLAMNCPEYVDFYWAAEVAGSSRTGQFPSGGARDDSHHQRWRSARTVLRGPVRGHGRQHPLAIRERAPFHLPRTAPGPTGPLTTPSCWTSGTRRARRSAVGRMTCSRSCTPAARPGARRA